MFGMGNIGPWRGFVYKYEAYCPTESNTKQICPFYD